MSDIEDYFTKKRAELGMERADTLSKVQLLLDEWYPKLVRAKSLNKGVLLLITASSAVANELHLRQIEFLTKLQLEETSLRLVVSDIES